MVRMRVRTRIDMKTLSIPFFVLFLVLSAASLTLFQERDESLSDPVDGGNGAVTDLTEKTGTITSTENKSKEDQFKGEVDSEALVLKKFGPNDIKAGEVFNKQPNGESAIWAQADNVTLTTALVLNNEVLFSQAYPKDNLVTALVPKNLYASPGEYPLWLLDTKTNRKSNTVKFIVR